MSCLRRDNPRPEGWGLPQLHDSCEGQALVEFAAVALVIVFAITGIGKLLRDQWAQAQCAYQVFETVHRKVTGSPILQRRFSIQLEETKTGVIGVGTCGPIKEVVRLPKLESAKWR